MTDGHLADDRLIELCLGAQVTATDRDHLAVCAACAVRRLSLEALLDDTAAVATREADRIFTAERLSRQHHRILQRLDQEGRPARVIAFPGGVQEPSFRPVRRSPRWIAAAAAAAGLAVGLLAGHLTDLPGAALGPERTLLSSNAGGSLRPVLLSDDEFLGQLELAVGSATPAVLNPLDALTPGASDLGR